MIETYLKVVDGKFDIGDIDPKIYKKKFVFIFWVNKDNKGLMSGFIESIGRELLFVRDAFNGTRQFIHIKNILGMLENYIK